MADRFPLIVNAISKKIEEIVSGDNLELTGNGIVVSGDTGAGKYLSSDGTTVFWNSPGDVYLTQTQTLTNKTLETCSLSGSLNTVTNLPNSSLVNSGITINGSTISLGGTVITPDNNTTYAIAAVDGLSANEKILRLTSGGNSGAGINDDIIIGVGAPSTIPSGSNALSLLIDRSGDEITISGTVVDNNTITTLESGTGGSPVTGAVVLSAGNFTTISQSGNNITITGQDTDTVTRLRATTGQSYNPGDFTFLSGGATNVVQGVDGSSNPTITISSTDTVTRLKGGSTGTLTSGDITITGGTNATVSQSGGVITVASTDTNTVTQIAADSNTLSSGDFRFAGGGATSLSQSTSNGVTTITVTSANDDTGASLGASGGLILDNGSFKIKNASNFSGNTILKWDSGNSQIADSLITDDGTTITIGGDLVVSGTQTILNTSVLQVEDNSIELRKGNNLTGSDGGIQLNLTTNSTGAVTSYNQLQWYNAGGYWRSWDGSVDNRFVTENETQVLTNKTLTAPTLTAPSIGAATATSINGLEITTTASAVLEIASSKTVEVSRSLDLTTNQPDVSTSVNFRVGGNVAYTSDTLATFSSTTSTQMRGLITDTTGLDRLVFQTSPNLLTSITTSSTTFSLLNATATSIDFGGATQAMSIGSSSGTTTINNSLEVVKSLTVGTGISDNIVLNGTVNSANADILIRGTLTDPMSVGRGGGGVGSNTRVGVGALQNNSSGSQNTAFGYQALFTNNSGAGNTAFGFEALRACGVGNTNVAIGPLSLRVLTEGDNNIAIGRSTLETASAGNSNVCIGHYAGHSATGSGNVLIGPADNENTTDVTFRPPNPSGNRQLVIGSGTNAWIKGDSNFDVTFDNDVRVVGDTTVEGNLIVNGTQTITKSNIVQISDKNLELAAVVSTQFQATCISGNATINGVTPTTGLIPGMEVQPTTVGFNFPSGTRIVSITGNSVVLNNNAAADGLCSFDAIGPSDLSADGGGITIKSSAGDKTLSWVNQYTAWTSSENFDLASGKQYRINNVNFLTSTQIGPSTGVIALGAGVTTSSLTSVGTLSALTVAGNVSLTGTGYIQLPSGTDAQRPGSPAEGMLRWNDTSNVFEGYNGTAWGAIGGAVEVSSSAPSNSVEGDLWYDSDDGRLFVYYNDGATTQWVDASPFGLPTDLVIEGDITPATDNSSDLGSATKRWANIYSADLQLSNEGAANDVDGTWGQYTIQEGEEDLFLINRRSGKKYKFMLQEVN